MYLAVVNQTCAYTNNYCTEVKLTLVDVTHWHVGDDRYNNEVVPVHMEWVKAYDVAYIKLGEFINNDHAFGAQVCIRYPIVLTEADKNGYYLGA